MAHNQDEAATVSHMVQLLQQRGTACGTERDKAGICMLSLDGGGVRGYSSLLILQALMAKLNYERKQLRSQNKQEPTPDIKPCEVFDLIGGTSTGGIIAIMLGRLRMSVEDCIAAYLDMFPNIFGKKENLIKIGLSGKIKPGFSSEKLEKAIVEVLGNRNISPETKLDDGEERACKTFVCAMRAEDKSYARIRDYTPAGEINHDSLTILQAALATSAASGFFAPLTAGNVKYVDAALGINNPINEVWGEAMNIWASETGVLQPLTKCVVSIGTGMPSKNPLSDTVYGMALHSLVEIATQAEKIAKDAESTTFRGWVNPGQENRYFRFNVDQGLQEVRLEDIKSTGTIKAVTADYLDYFRIKSALQNCARNLGSKELFTSMFIATEMTKSSIISETKRDKTQLATLFPSLNMEEVHIDNRDNATGPNRRHPGAWVLQNDAFVQWFASDASCGLWLRGKVGTGKTVLMSTIIQSLIDSAGTENFSDQCDNILAYFYCTDRHHINDIFKSILFQLADNPTALAILKPLTVRDETVHLSRKSLEDLLRDVVGKSMKSHCFLVIDALDELREDVYSFLEFLVGLVSESQISLKIIVSSRTGLRNINTVLESSWPIIEVIEDHTEEDIKTLIVTEVPMYARRRGIGEDLESQIKNTLIDRAKGMFKYVSMAIKHIFQHWRPADIRAALLDLPEGLDALYDEFFKAIEHPIRHAELAKRVIKGLMAQAVPLPSEVFLQAVNFSKDPDIESITHDHVVEICHFLVDYNKATNSFDFSHASVLDYIKEHRQGDFNKQATHTLLAETCLAAITEQRCYEALKESRDRQKELHQYHEEYENHSLRDFAQYALICWSWHFLKAGDAVLKSAPGLNQRLQNFFLDSEQAVRFSTWAREFSLFFGLWVPYKILSTSVPVDIRSRWIDTLLKNGEPSPLLTAIAFQMPDILNDFGNSGSNHTNINKQGPRDLAVKYGMTSFLILSPDPRPSITSPRESQLEFFQKEWQKAYKRNTHPRSPGNFKGASSSLLIYEILGRFSQNPFLKDLPKAFSGTGPGCEHQPFRSEHSPLEGVRPGLSSQWNQPDQDTVYNVIFHCSKCLYHFSLRVDYTRRVHLWNPCDFHHFQLMESKFHPGDLPDDLHQCYTSRKWSFILKCHNLKCQTMVWITVTPPRLRTEVLSVLFDEATVTERGWREVALDPKRYEEYKYRDPSSWRTLGVLMLYLKDSLTGRGRRIASKNKHFRLGFSDDCDELLQLLGFEIQLEDETDTAEGPMKYWGLPDVSSLTTNLAHRAFIQDVLMELIERRANIKADKIIFDWPQALPPIPVLGTIQACFKNGSVNGSPLIQMMTEWRNTDLDLYSTLGAVKEFSDELVYLAYRRQIECDPAKREDYLRILKTIARKRNSSFLLFKIARTASVRGRAAASGLVGKPVAERSSDMGKRGGQGQS